MENTVIGHIDMLLPLVRGLFALNRRRIRKLGQFRARRQIPDLGIRQPAGLIQAADVARESLQPLLDRFLCELFDLAQQLRIDA